MRWAPRVSRHYSKKWRGRANWIEFASEHDAQLGFTIRACSASWSTGLRTAARSTHGVRARCAARSYGPARDGGRRACARAGFDAQAAFGRRCHPRSRAGSDPAPGCGPSGPQRTTFVRMREAAQALASAMDGVVTDDNGCSAAPDTRSDGCHLQRAGEPVRRAGTARQARACRPRQFGRCLPNTRAAHADPGLVCPRGGW